MNIHFCNNSYNIITILFSPYSGINSNDNENKEIDSGPPDPSDKLVKKHVSKNHHTIGSNEESQVKKENNLLQ